MDRKEFRKKLYRYIYDRTVMVRQGSKMPFISWQSAKRFGKKHGFDEKPVVEELIILQEKGAIYSRKSMNKRYYIARL